jgi:hypothetical protein
VYNHMFVSILIFIGFFISCAFFKFKMTEKVIKFFNGSFNIELACSCSTQSMMP